MSLRPGARRILRVLPLLALTAGCDAGASVPLGPSSDQRTTSLAAAFDCAVDQSELPITECKALVDLFVSTNGASWTSNAGWLQSPYPCTWFGVSCYGRGSVIFLFLPSNNLTGRLPESLGALTNLDRLYLRQNRLTGTIPPSLGSLPQLTSLVLAENQLVGGLPQSLGSLSNLTSLDVATNRLSGPIPESIGNLLNLGGLWVHHNQLTGVIPEGLGALRSLRYLNLSMNRLRGAIPPALGGLTSLRYLILAGNDLQGNVPPSLVGLSSLQGLDIANNTLAGVIPLAVAQFLGQQDARGSCSLSGNANLLLRSGPRYLAADLDMDGFICDLQFPAVRGGE